MSELKPPSVGLNTLQCVARSGALFNPSLIDKFLIHVKWPVPCSFGAARNDRARFECSYDQAANSAPLSLYLTLCYMCSIPLLGVSKFAPVVTFFLLYSSATGHKSSSDLSFTSSHLADALIQSAHGRRHGDTKRHSHPHVFATWNTRSVKVLERSRWRQMRLSVPWATNRRTA